MSSAQFLLRMRPYFRQVVGELVLGSLCGILMNTAVVLPALLLGRAIDEVLRFRLETGIEGIVRVLREHVPNEYALRFEELSLDALSRLEQLA